MRIVWAVLLPSALLASAVCYYASTVAAAPEPGSAANAQPAEAKPRESSAASPPATSASPNIVPAAKDTASATAAPADKPAASPPATAEPPKTSPAAKDTASAPAAPADKPAASPPATSPPAAAEPPKTVPAAPADKPAAPPPAAAKAVKWPPLTGSKLKDDDNSCITCHTKTAELWGSKGDAQYHFYVAEDPLKKDVHYQKGVNCSDCHGGDRTVTELAAHQTDDFRPKLADIQKACAHCHENQVARLNASPHRVVAVRDHLALGGAKPVTSCLDCHAGKDEQGKIAPHTISASLKEKLSRPAEFCGQCHAKEVDDLRMSDHHAAGPPTAENAKLPKNEQAGTLLNCGECHGQLTHDLLPVKDAKSPVHLQGQIQTCGKCHGEQLKSFLATVHGEALEKKGLTVGPVCADCHGAHNIYRPHDDRSTLFVTHVGDTCGKCHDGIEERLKKSVHGRGDLGGNADRPAPGGTNSQKPTCTSCHGGHVLPSPASVAFRETLPNHCGNCHVAMFSSYALSMHGKLTDLGYAPAAKCSDCHGSHDILPLDDPDSTLSPANRAFTCGRCHTKTGRREGNGFCPRNQVHTCGDCHAKAGANFVHFDPHINASDAHKNPIVNGVRVTLLTLLYSTFLFFGVHSLLWFIRGLVEVLKHGRPHGLRPGQTAYVRFVSFHRIGHTIMMSSFLGLALTGLPLKYHDADWAKSLARFMGGFASTSFWHRFFGVILLVSMLVYMARMVRLLVEGRNQGRTLLEMVFGSDSPIPTLRDLKDFLKMLRWFFGLGPRPGFDRWSYWEKIDFWGAIADTVIIGSTGLVLWFPNLFCGPLPGATLNIAIVVHSTQALLATGFVFAIHFFNTHFRPDRFPADMSVLTGLVSEEEFKEDRPEYFERLEREGKLEALRTTSPGLFVLSCIRGFGFLALAIGLALLLGMIIASL